MMQVVLMWIGFLIVAGIGVAILAIVWCWALDEVVKTTRYHVWFVRTIRYWKEVKSKYPKDKC